MSELVTRKLQKVGGGTFTVSIPKEWSAEHGLDAGSEVHLYPHTDGSLVLRGASRNGTPLGSARFDVERGSVRPIERVVRTAYAAGFEELTVGAEDGVTPEQRRAADEVAQELLGLEVVAEGPGEISLRNLLASPEVSVEQSMSQLRFLAVSMYRTAVRRLADGGDAHDHADRQRDEVRRLAGLVERHFSRSLSSFEEVDHLRTGRARLFEYRTVARALEGVADDAVALSAVAARADGVAGEGEPIDAVAVEEVPTLVDEAVSAVLDGDDAEAAHDALDRVDDARARLDRSEDRRGLAARSGVEVRVTDRLRRTLGHAGEIGHVALRAATRATNCE